MLIADTIFLVVIGQFAVVALRAGRKWKGADFLSQLHIGRVFPNLPDGLLKNRSDKKFRGMAPPVAKVRVVGVKQGPAWTDFAVPTNAHTASFNEGTYIPGGRWIPCGPCSASDLGGEQVDYGCGCIVAIHGWQDGQRRFLRPGLLAMLIENVLFKRFSVSQQIADRDLFDRKPTGQFNDFRQFGEIVTTGDKGDPRF